MAISTADDLANGFITVVPAAEHGGRLTMDLLRRSTGDLSRPAVFKALVPLPDPIHTRAFYEDIAPDQKTVWRKQREGVGVDMADRYDYVTGEEGPAREFIEQVFSGAINTYAFLGPLAYGLGARTDEPTWGSKVFRRIKDAIFGTPWLDIERWRMTGQVFFGSCTTEFGEVSDGHPGSDWHSAASVNVFVMVSGLRKWMTFPPRPGEQLGKRATRIEGALRVEPDDISAYDTVHLSPGDVLFNPPFEWHKVLNSVGFSCGVAFRLKDVTYGHALIDNHMRGVAAEVGADDEAVEQAKRYMLTLLYSDDLEGEDGALHLLTSAMYASRDPRRAALLLGIVEANIMQMALGAIMQSRAADEE